MLKQRLVTFFTKEEAEEFALKVNGICIPKLEVIDGHFYELYEVWIEYEEEVESNEIQNS